MVFRFVEIGVCFYTVNGRINGEYHFYSAEISNNRRAEGESVIILARLNKSDIHHLSLLTDLSDPSPLIRLIKTITLLDVYKQHNRK